MLSDSGLIMMMMNHDPIKRKDTLPRQRHLSLFIIILIIIYQLFEVSIRRWKMERYGKHKVKNVLLKLTTSRWRYCTTDKCNGLNRSMNIIMV